MGAPRHRPGGFALTLGVFVQFRDGKIRLVDYDHNVYDLTRVRLAQGTWGDNVEGVQKLPRVQVRDAQSGAVLVQGDQVLIGFLRGQPRTPYVLGGVRPAGDHDVLARDHAVEGADQNALKVLLVARDGEGTEGGRVYVEAGAGAGGAVLVQATQGVTVQVSDPIGAAGALELDLAPDKATVSKGGATEPVPLGRTLLTDLQSALTEISGYLNGLGLVTPNTLAMIGKITTSLAAGGPYLSTTLDTE